MVDGHTIDTDGHTITGRRSFVVRFFCVSNSLLPTTCMSVISSVLLSTSLCASHITHTLTSKQTHTFYSYLICFRYFLTLWLTVSFILFLVLLSSLASNPGHSYLKHAIRFTIAPAIINIQSAYQM